MNHTFLAVLAAAALGTLACSDEETSSSSSTSSSAKTSAATTGAGGMTTSAGGGTSSGGIGGAGGAGDVSVSLAVDPSTMSPGDTITGTVMVTGFALEAPMNQPNQDGHGHFHIYLDGATGINYLIADQTTTVPIGIPLQTTPGPHTLRISLGENNHAALVPAVEDIVDITVE